MQTVSYQNRGAAEGVDCSPQCLSYMGGKEADCRKLCEKEQCLNCFFLPHTRQCRVAGKDLLNFVLTVASCVGFCLSEVVC